VCVFTLKTGLGGKRVLRNQGLADAANSQLYATPSLEYHTAFQIKWQKQPQFCVNSKKE